VGEGTDPAARDVLVQAALFAGQRVGAASVSFHTKLAEHFGLGPTDMKTLDLVERAGSITPSELAEQMGFAPASVTAILDRLTKKRLLRRIRHPSDGRRFIVEFDPAAFDQLAPLHEGFVLSLTEMLAAYDDGELDLIARVFNETADRQHAAALALDDPTA
jgi:DNA-binding MarR family transcriptional regulator